mmetsp:Transcript_31300/g.105365  ORF Transcript_31300/g.105365 Transcript_31300/m.105365 type:complete len:296 (-) Transcript_31300:383-1270(-)
MAFRNVQLLHIRPSPKRARPGLPERRRGRTLPGSLPRGRRGGGWVEGGRGGVSGGWFNRLSFRKGVGPGRRPARCLEGEGAGRLARPACCFEGCGAGRLPRSARCFEDCGADRLRRPARWFEGFDLGRRCRARCFKGPGRRSSDGGRRRDRRCKRRRVEWAEGELARLLRPLPRNPAVGARGANLLRMLCPQDLRQVLPRARGVRRPLFHLPQEPRFRKRPPANPRGACFSRQRRGATAPGRRGYVRRLAVRARSFLFLQKSGATGPRQSTRKIGFVLRKRLRRRNRRRIRLSLF